MVFQLLSESIKSDIQDYAGILTKIQENILTVRKKVDAVFNLLDAYDETFKKIKLKLGESAKKEELTKEFDKVVTKNYGEHAIRKRVSDLTASVNALGIAEMRAPIQENK